MTSFLIFYFRTPKKIQRHTIKAIANVSQILSGSNGYNHYLSRSLSQSLNSRQKLEIHRKESFVAPCTICDTRRSSLYYVQSRYSLCSRAARNRRDPRR